jgi:hypothetical protein
MMGQRNHITGGHLAEECKKNGQKNTKSMEQFDLPAHM